MVIVFIFADKNVFIFPSQFYPTHSKGLILMGDININHLKNLDAAETNFLTILKLEPENVQANHNLCVVYVEKGLLLEAEKCLQHAHQMAPHEDYIKQHLNIVRSRIYKAQQVGEGLYHTLALWLPHISISANNPTRTINYMIMSL